MDSYNFNYMYDMIFHTQFYEIACLNLFLSLFFVFILISTKKFILTTQLITYKVYKTFIRSLFQE